MFALVTYSEEETLEPEDVRDFPAFFFFFNYNSLIIRYLYFSCLSHFKIKQLYFKSLNVINK